MLYGSGKINYFVVFSCIACIYCNNTHLGPLCSVVIKETKEIDNITLTKISSGFDIKDIGLCELCLG